MIKRFPSMLVAAVLFLVFAAWPTVEQWAELTAAHHYLVHALYLVAGGLFGWQTSRWVNQPATAQGLDDAGVSS